MATNASQSNISNSGINYSGALRILSLLFLVWGSVIAVNNTLLDGLKSAMNLSPTQQQLIDLGFFIAYFVMSLPAGWLINRVGYKKGLVFGLGVAALGAALFYPAAEYTSPEFLLAAYFTLATGIAVLQTGANPYVVVLGSPDSSAARLNRAQGYYSLGMMLFPLFIATVVFGNVLTPEQKVAATQLPFLIISAVLAIGALLISMSSLPRIGNTTKEDKAKEDVPNAWTYTHLIMAAVAIFLYTGAEATILQFMPKYLGSDGLNVATGADATKFKVLFLAAIMVGRFMGSSLQKVSSVGKKTGSVLLWVGVGFLFAKCVLSNTSVLFTGIANFDFTMLSQWMAQGLIESILFALLAGFALVGFIIGNKKGPQTILTFALVAVLLVSVSLSMNNNLVIGTTTISIAAWALIALGFFSSIMFPNIFALGLKELGKSTSQGSAIMVMAMVGGFALPLLIQPAVGSPLGVRHALFLVFIPYLYLIYYGADGYSVRQRTISRGMADAAIGIDIGASTTNIGIVDRKGNVINETLIYTEDHKTPEALVKAIHLKVEDLLQNTKQAVNIKGVGIGAPNGNFFKGTLDNPINLEYEGVIPLVNLLEKHIKLPIKLTNDANAAALGEMLYGGAKGMQNFIAITLGSNLGSGIVVNGEVVYGKDGHAGELGHTNVQPEGRLCSCGKRGCLQTYVSANGLIRTVQTILGDTIEKSQLRAIKPDELTGKMVYTAANQGDNIAIEAFAKTGEVLGRKLADTVAHTSPEAIFLMGGLAKAGEILFEPTREALKANLLSVYDNQIPVLESELASSPAILGAAALVWTEIDEEIEKN